jgi:hypothetical protein
MRCAETHRWSKDVVKLPVKPPVKTCGGHGRYPEAGLGVVELPHPIHNHAQFWSKWSKILVRSLTSQNFWSNYWSKFR